MLLPSIVSVVMRIKPVFPLQVSNYMPTPDAQAEAKGQAQEDDSKSNAIPEVGLKFSLLLLLT